MSVIANLDINLRGNTGGIEKAANTSSKKLGELKNSVNQHAYAVESRFAAMKNKLGGIMSGLSSAFSAATKGIAGLGLAAVGAGAAIFAFSRKEADAIDKLGKTADKIGITTESLSGLHHAASLAGVDADALDSSLTALNQTFAGIGVAGGETGRALARIGINIESMKGLGAEEQFMRIADSLNAVGDHAQRVTLATQIFGESGSRYLKMFENGSEGVKRAMAEASELGLTVSRQQAAEVEASNQAITKMKAGFTGLFRTAAVALAPFIKMAVDGITQALKWLNSFREQILDFGNTASFVWKNFGDYASLAFDRVLYGATKLVNQIAHLFTEVLPEAFKAALSGMLLALSGKDIDKVIDAALARIKQKLADRQEGAIEANLRQTYESAAKALESRRQKFLAERKEAMNVTPKKTGGEGVSEVVGMNRNAVAERGSQEAFAIIAGQQKDKMLAKANEQLTELRKTNKLLDKILNKRAAAAVGRGRI